MLNTCANGHPQRTSLDRTVTGECRHCEHDRAAKYRARRKKAMDLFRSLEAAGIDVSDLNKAERIVTAAKLVAIVSDTTDGRAQLRLQRDPKLRTAALEMVEQLAGLR
jgi:hypothetical protein